MYFLLKMGIFHGYVSLPEGMYLVFGWGEAGRLRKSTQLENFSVFRDVRLCVVFGCGGGSWCCYFWASWMAEFQFFCWGGGFVFL